MFKTLRHWFSRLLSVFALILSLISLLLIVYDFGFPQSPATRLHINDYYNTLLIATWFVYTFRMLISSESPGGHARIGGRVVIYTLFTIITLSLLSVRYHILTIDNFLGLITGSWSVMVMLTLMSAIEISRAVTNLMGRRTNPAVVIAFSFATIIFIGSLLLTLPNCTHGSLSYIDSLFISTSAVCVTGLTPVDISATFTPTGFVILLILIQIGGLGIMTLTSFFGLFFTGQSFAGQLAVRDLVSSDNMTGLLRFLLRIIIVTLSVEATGALLIYLSIVGDATMVHSDALFFSIFHAISAFCNAGFSTLSGNLYDPAIRSVQGAIWVISWLIIFGSLGFPVFSNFLKIAGHRIRNTARLLIGRRAIVTPHLWQLNSFIVVRTTAILVVVGWGLLTAIEWNGALAQYSFSDKLTQGFLMAVTPRTAGFNGVNMNSMLPASLLITMVLMWIGGAPQSTAGGIKVTTFYLAMRNIVAGLGMHDRIETKGREIPSSSVRRALGVIVASVIVILTATVVMSLLEPTIDAFKLLFEVISALGTVGLSLGVTPELSTASKVIDILLMFVGRIGIVSMLAIFIKRRISAKPYSLPQENILIS